MSSWRPLGGGVLVEQRTCEHRDTTDAGHYLRRRELCGTPPGATDRAEDVWGARPPDASGTGGLAVGLDGSAIPRGRRSTRYRRGDSPQPPEESSEQARRPQPNPSRRGGPAAAAYTVKQLAVSL